MGEGEETTEGGASRRRVVYCLVPADLAPTVHDPLRRHFRDQADIEVIVERRRRDRRTQAERRNAEPGEERADRRRIHSTTGRRVADRRVPRLEAQAPELPRRLRRHVERISFFERVEPSTQQAEDIDTARLVTRFQAGERDEPFTAIYTRYFDRIYGYLRTALRDRHEAEDAAQEVMTALFEALPDYERRGQPFRAWLFRLVRNEAIDRLRKHGRLELEDPSEIDRSRDGCAEQPEAAPVLDWITDRDLVLFVERLPLAQRQVLLLRYGLDLSNTEIAKILGRTPVDVGSLHHRAMKFLGARLAAVGRTPVGRDRRAQWQRRPQTVHVLRARRFALTWRA